MATSHDHDPHDGLCGNPSISRFVKIFLLPKQYLFCLRHPNIRTKLHAIFEDFWHVGTLSRLAIYALRCFDTSSHASHLTWLSTFDLTEVQNELDLAQPYMDKAPVVSWSNKNCCSDGDGSEPSPKSSYDSFKGWIWSFIIPGILLPPF